MDWLLVLGLALVVTLGLAWVADLDVTLGFSMVKAGTGEGMTAGLVGGLSAFLRWVLGPALGPTLCVIALVLALCVAMSVAMVLALTGGMLVWVYGMGSTQGGGA